MTYFNKAPELDAKSDHETIASNSPLRAIRKYCLACSGKSQKEVTFCVIPDCALFPFRFGRNPHRQGVGSLSNLRPAKARKKPDRGMINPSPPVKLEAGRKKSSLIKRNKAERDSSPGPTSRANGVAPCRTNVIC